MLTADQRQTIAAALAEQQQRTQDRLVGLDRDFAVIVEAVDLSPPDDEHDPEGATVGFERAQLSALREHAREQLLQIEAAQQRLLDGSYGACAVCGRAIAFERLLARPTAAACVACS